MKFLATHTTEQTPVSGNFFFFFISVFFSKIKFNSIFFNSGVSYFLELIQRLNGIVKILFLKKKKRKEI